MGLLDKFKKKTDAVNAANVNGADGGEEQADAKQHGEEQAGAYSGSGQVIHQDLSEKAQPGMVFLMQLLFKEHQAMPDQQQMTEIMMHHVGKINNFGYSETVACFAAEDYRAEFSEGKIPPQLMITGCTDFDESRIGVMERSQMWDCPESQQILSECRYQVATTDMMAATLHYKERAKMDMDFLEALMEIFPDCQAVYFPSSGKMFTADAIRSQKMEEESRFIYFAVNVRLFNIQGSEDKVVDTLGMNVLFMPDLQYHFRGMDPNWVVNHAYNLLSYMYDNENPIESGNTVDGVVDGRMNRDVQWKCQYEEALIQPAREVLDVCMNEYAAGRR